MYTRAIGPGQMRVFVEEGDPVVLTDPAGVVVAGPHPTSSNRVVVFDYKGPRVPDACWGVLNPDGTVGWQSKLVVTLYGYDRISIKLDQPEDDYLTPGDRRWLQWVTGFMRGPGVRLPEPKLGCEPARWLW